MIESKSSVVQQRKSTVVVPLLSSLSTSESKNDDQTSSTRATTATSETATANKRVIITASSSLSSEGEQINRERLPPRKRQMTSVNQSSIYNESTTVNHSNAATAATAVVGEDQQLVVGAGGGTNATAVSLQPTTAPVAPVVVLNAPAAPRNASLAQAAVEQQYNAVMVNLAAAAATATSLYNQQSLVNAITTQQQLNSAAAAALRQQQQQQQAQQATLMMAAATTVGKTSGLSTRQQAPTTNVYTFLLQQGQLLQQQRQQQQTYQNTAAAAAATVVAARSRLNAGSTAATVLSKIPATTTSSSNADIIARLRLQQELSNRSITTQDLVSTIVAASGTPSLNVINAPQESTPSIHTRVGVATSLAASTTALQEPPQYDENYTICLYLPSCDEERLSNYQILLRKQIEFFQASQEDVDIALPGRKRCIKKGQVGVRCKHCAHVPLSQRLQGTTYFPFTLLGLYQVAQNLGKSHLCGCCENTPKSTKQELISYREAKRSKAGHGGKQYWADAAKALDLVETEHGLYFKFPATARIPTTRALHLG